MLSRCLIIAVVGAALSASMFAQKGDRPNEVQRSLPADWKVPPAPILSADDEAKTFVLAPGFHAELAASEPLVGDPVAAVFAPDGRLWVVEMRGYMPDVDAFGEDAKVGDVAILEDTDHDGRFDKRTVFMDKLVLPRALAVVGDGALVAEPPHLWFARDTNGDGVADAKVEIASNYGGTGNPEHMANGLVWMRDNAIYSANHTARFRFQGGDTFVSEPTITRGQWGITQDDLGRIYYNSNSDPLRVDIIPSEYFWRNPHLANPQGTNVQLAPEDLPTWPGRITPGVNRGYQTLRPDGTLAAVTAACSPVIYRGTLFPPEFRGDAFICEPSGNLVKRIRLTEKNGVPVGTNAYEKAEFLTSTDERFRPVSAYNAPDGALWVIDMYRGVIQHRTYVTTYLRNQIKDRRLEEGRGLGRIWRIVPDHTPAKTAIVKLDQFSTAELVQQLGSGSGWISDTAQQRLVERRDSAAVPLLQSVIRSRTAPALARQQALWTLEGISALDRTSVIEAIRDRDPIVCAAGIRLAERWLHSPTDQEIFREITSLLTADGAVKDPHVVLQIALSLGACADAQSTVMLASVARSYGELPYLADAIATGLAGRETAFLAELAKFPGATAASAPASAAIRSIFGAENAADVLAATEMLAQPNTEAWLKDAILDGIDASLPRRADGAKSIAELPTEPTSLVRLSLDHESVRGKRAEFLLQHLRWPGKPGNLEPATPLTPEENARFERGRAQYAALCANCHQPNGKGLAGLAPPLVNSRWALGPAPLAASIVLCGKEDDGKVMPTLRSVLDDEAIASVLTFVRRSWGHTATPVDIATVATARAATAQQAEPLHEQDLIEHLRAFESSGTR
jgi:mono/diheme cytochrome c family protein/glucose/arabinose dehydrogenase